MLVAVAEDVWRISPGNASGYVWTTQFLEGAPEWVATGRGKRVGLEGPVSGGDEYVAWLTKRGKDPEE